MPIGGLCLCIYMTDWPVEKERKKREEERFILLGQIMPFPHHVLNDNDLTGHWIVHLYMLSERDVHIYTAP